MKFKVYTSDPYGENVTKNAKKYHRRMDIHYKLLAKCKF